jgi:hypothetical protein
MPATDYPTLYDFETQIETAFITAFTAASLTSYAQQSNETKTSPFLNVQVTIGAGRREYAQTSAGRANKNFEFTLEVQIVTARTASGTPNATHKTMRGKVRNLLERWLSANTGGSNVNASLSYVRIIDMSRAGGQRGVDEDQTFDITTESYAGVFQVKDDAWPT